MYFPPHISKSLNFKKFTDTELLAAFDKDIQWVEKVSVKFSTGNVLQPKRKLRILRIRLKNLEPKGNKAQGYAKILPLRNDTQHQLVSLLKHFLYLPAVDLPTCLVFPLTGLCVDMTSFSRRTKRSPSGQFPVKNPTSKGEKNCITFHCMYGERFGWFYSSSRIVHEKTSTAKTKQNNTMLPHSKKVYIWANWLAGTFMCSLHCPTVIWGLG